MPMLVATDREVLAFDVERGTSISAHGITDRPTCLAADAFTHDGPEGPSHRFVHGRAWCGTHRLWIAIEAGALVSTIDGGRTWRDRVAGGPWDTHELAVHRNAPDTLRVSAGDGYFAPLLCADANAGELWAADERGLHRSDDRGKSWRRVAGYATPPQHRRGLALLQ